MAILFSFKDPLHIHFHIWSSVIKDKKIVEALQGYLNCPTEFHSIAMSSSLCL